MLFNNEGKAVTEQTISADLAVSIMEQVMMDTLNEDEMSMFLENQSEIDSALEEGVLMERTIVKLDKHAKLSRAYKAAIFKLAKEKNDPKFKKLVTIWKMERSLEDYLEKKYGSQAMRAAKQTVRNAQNSKSSVVAKAANRAKATLNK